MKLPYDIEYAVAIALKQGIPRITISEEQAEKDNNLRNKRAKQIEKRDKVISGIERFWEVYTDKLSSQYQQFGSAVEKAKAASSKYQAMSVDDKIKVIGLVLVATHAGSGRVDMKKSFPKLGLPDGFGRMKDKNLNPTKLTFVYESITGLHCHKLDGKLLEQDQ